MKSEPPHQQEPREIHTYPEGKSHDVPGHAFFPHECIAVKLSMSSVRCIFLATEEQHRADLNDREGCNRPRGKHAATCTARVPDLEPVYVEVRRKYGCCRHAHSAEHIVAWTDILFPQNCTYLCLYTHLHLESATFATGLFAIMMQNAARPAGALSRAAFTHVQPRAKYNTKGENELQEKPPAKQPTEKEEEKPLSVEARDEQLRLAMLDRDGGHHAVGTVNGEYESGLGVETRKNMFRVI